MTVTEMLAEKTIIVDTQVAALKREREENKRLRDALLEAIDATEDGVRDIVNAALAEQSATTSAQVETVCRCPLPLRAILDWWMCSDPWPGGDHDAVETWLTCLCSERGYDGWAVAYHEVAEPSEEESDG